MYTANTMAAVGEALGMSLPGSASARPRSTTGVRCSPASPGSRAAELVPRADPLPRDILTKEAFENAIAVVMAVAGSTNAVLHLLAIAREAHVDLQLDDFDRIGRTVPHLVDVRPAGRFVMSDIDRVGGVQVVLKELLDGGTSARRLPDRDRARRSPRTWRRWTSPEPDGDVVHAPSDPIHPWGGLAILRGNLAPDGAVVKAAGAEGLVFEGAAKPFDSEKEAFDALTSGVDRPRRRHRDPLRGSEGLARACPRCSPSRRRWRARASARTWRSSPTAGSAEPRRGSASGTSRPRRSWAGRSRWCDDGDAIRIDVDARTIEVLVDDADPGRSAAQSWIAARVPLHAGGAREVRPHRGRRPTTGR